jgi:ATP-dependent helicase/nuclease subunit A
MTEKYLDVTKSVIISSPAGSGKTEKLARRYISLLEEGSQVEKILCITFTEKAAAEMKQRIISVLSREHPELLEKIREKIPLMRISTIHSFCLRVLRRFAIELGIDPSMAVMDELTSRNIWNEAVYEGLTAEREAPGMFFRMTTERGLRGWNVLKRLLDELHSRRPYPELIIKQGTGEGAAELMELYSACLKRYGKKKLEKRLLDYNDLEMMAYAALSLGPEAHNILYSFDEHTDHLLVDEFQDTSTLQWLIIDKLTEEWRSGMGAKREAGKTPTVFLVGDDKQSIYLFRGANVSLFQEARERLAGWMGVDYNYIEVKENFRSLPAIVEFTNRLFERLMPPALVEPWITRYSPFEAARAGEGRVELVLLEGRGSTKDTRLNEAEAIARIIGSLHGRHEVFKDGTMQPCGYEDMAVLIRRRTHLGLFEDALRRAGIPFIVLKGIGFYDEPEIALLRELISFLADPSDNYSLFCVLRSPLFQVDYKTLVRLIKSRATLMEKLMKSRNKRLREAAARLEGWLGASPSTPLAVLIERVFTETGGWAMFREKQRRANVKKFIAMVEGFEAQGLTPLEIREKLLRRRRARDEAKANINAEGMNAVRIMTVHAAKGLEFPMVFLPSLDERITPGSSAIVTDDTGGRLSMAFSEAPDRYRKDERFRRQRLKEHEEEKRLFYVAVTRARDYLCMISSPSGKTVNTRHGFLEDAFDLENTASLPFDLVLERDLHQRYPLAGPAASDVPGGFMLPPAYTEPIGYRPGQEWMDVTDVDRDVGLSHGEDWTLTGSVMHRLFEELSRGWVDEKDLEERALQLLSAGAAGKDGLVKVIMEDMGKLKKSGLMDDIILPRPGAMAELPFVLERDERVYSGRIDRLLIRNGAVHVYDYKTFPVRKGETALLVEKYRFQMETYATAAQKLYSKPARAYLVFTHAPRVVEVGTDSQTQESILS